MGQEVPAALIHQAPTPRELAAALEHALVRTDGHIGVLQAGGDEPPVFCIADLFGHAFNYLSLARRLGPDRTVYGVAPGPLQEAFARDGDVARLAESFACEIVSLRPEGPYVIAGYSAGGLLALEVAARLSRDGGSSALILLDAYRHSRRPSLGRLLRWSSHKGRGEATAGVVSRLFPRTGRAPALPDWVPPSQAPFAMSLIRAGLRHTPSTFDGPALVVRADQAGPLDRLFDDGLLGWGGVLKGVVTEAGAPGAHHDFLREPYVAQTARHVRRFLTEFRATHRE
jgi:thioesterase domain-containing protein